MSRLTEKHYQQRVMLAMVAYVAVMVLVWPLVRMAGSLPLRWILALAPLAPMLYVIALMAQRIRRSDELEQRTHLIGLGVATGVVGALSLAGGFLAAAGVVPLHGSVLIWVFPVTMACYGVTRMQLLRRYGNDFGCASDDAMPLHWRLITGAALIGFVAVFAYLKRDALYAGMLVGMAIGMAAIALVKAAAAWQKRRAARTGGDA